MRVRVRVRVNLGVRDVRGVRGDDAADVRHVAAVAVGRHEAVDAAGLRAARPILAPSAPALAAAG